MDPDSEEYQKNLVLIERSKHIISELSAGIDYTPPTIAFADRMTLDMGDVNLQMIYFGKGGHSGSDIIILVPEEKLVVTGDLFLADSLGLAAGDRRGEGR